MKLFFLDPIGNICSFKNFTAKFTMALDFIENPKNWCEYLVLHNTCITVCYFKNYDLNFSSKLDWYEFGTVKINRIIDSIL